MIEAIVEGGGIIVGLGLLLYFQVLRTDPSAPRTKPGINGMPRPAETSTDPDHPPRP